MGSDTEGVLSFSFRKDTPDYVLAAFSALADPLPPGAPPLPAPVEADPLGRMATDYAQDEDELGMLELDPFPGEPWRHDWAGLLSASMGVAFVGHSRMLWSEMEFWTISARFSLKDDPDRLLKAFGWLGPHIERNSEEPLLLGYLRHEYQIHPILVWHQANRVYGEDLRDESDGIY
jgi:hypothetical protein